jgi:hypothetical protein
MARTRTHKLLLSRDPAHARCFDLERDPLELHDLSGDVAAAPLMRRLREALADWALFDALPPSYHDDAAPIIQQPNARRGDADHRAEMTAYFEWGVRRYLDL